MKRNIILLIGILISAVSFAQDDICFGETEDQQVLCKEAYSIWQGDREQSDKEIAHQSWHAVRAICPPCVSERMYTEGASYYSKKVKSNKEDSVLQQVYVDSLLSIYLERVEHFPKKTAYVHGLYGTQLFKYRPDQYNAAQEYLKPSVHDLKSASKPTVLQAYYYTIYKQYADAVEKEDSILKVEKKIELLKEYVVLDDFVQGGIANAKNEKAKGSYEKVRKNLLKIFLQVESGCESLTDLIKNNLMKDGDAAAMKTAATILTLKECTDSDIYIEAVQGSDDGSHKSAFAIGFIYLKSENSKEALTWFETAIERCNAEGEACEAKLDYLLRAGQTANLSGSTSKAKGFARSILDISSGNADAYMILADAWANSNCNDENFGKACSYWVAYDYYARAKNANPELAEKAGKSMSRIRSGWPSKADIFRYGITAGSSYTCCGATTTVRTRD